MLGATPKLIRTPEDLEGVAGLIMPGGESTTMLKFLERNGFFEVLQNFVKTTPTFGTCAGAILLASHVEHPAQKSLGALDITVERNAYGRQIDSTILKAETSLAGGAAGDGLHPGSPDYQRRAGSRDAGLAGGFPGAGPFRPSFGCHLPP